MEMQGTQLPAQKRGPIKTRVRREGITVISKLHICEEPTSAASMGVGHGQRMEVREAVGRNAKTSPSLRPSI